MKIQFILFLVLIISTQCTVKPAPLRYAVDNCDFCKMKLMDDRFGGELVTNKGKVFKFDDIKCLVSFLNTGEGKAHTYSYELVVDYAHAEDQFDLVPAADAFYISSPEVNSPMGGNIAAFKNRPEHTEYMKKWNGRDLSWTSAKAMFK